MCTAQHLTSIDDKVPKTASRADKFPDYNADKTKPDIYLHDTDGRRDGTRQDYLCEYMAAFAAQRIDQLHFVLTDLAETGVEV